MTTVISISKLLLQRVRVLLQLITLGDIEDCVPHLAKIATLAPDVWSALDPLYREQRYGDMIAWLAEWEKNYAGIQVYIDPETEALKTELRLLTAQVEELQAEYGYRERRIAGFEHHYMQELGTLIEELLSLRVESARIAYEDNPTEETSFAYEQARKQFADTVHEKDRLRSDIQRVRRVIEELRTAIADIEQNDTYQIILTMTDEQEYFRLKKEQLREEIERYRADM